MVIVMRTLSIFTFVIVGVHLSLTDQPGQNIVLRKCTIINSTQFYCDFLDNVTQLVLEKVNISSLVVRDSTLDTIPPNIFAWNVSVVDIRFISCGLKILKPLNFDPIIDIVSLTISDNEIKVLPSNTFESLEQIQNLYLENNHFEVLDPNAFVGLYQLEYLILVGNDLATLPEGVFFPLTSLYSINLSNNNLMELDDDAFLRNEQLGSLYLNDNKLKIVDIESPYYQRAIRRKFARRFETTSLGFLQNLKETHTLDLSGNFIKYLGNNVFENMHNLNNLNLGRTEIESIENGTFSGTSIALLNLSANKLRSFDVEGVFCDIPNLENLYLEYNSLETIEYKSLKSCAPQLKQIALNGNKWQCRFLLEMAGYFVGEKVHLLSPNTTTSNTTRNILNIQCFVNRRDVQLPCRMEAYAIIVMSVVVVFLLLYIISKAYYDGVVPCKGICCCKDKDENEKNLEEVDMDCAENKEK